MAVPSEFLTKGDVGASILLPESEGGLTAAALAKSEDEQLLKALDLLKAKIKAKDR